MWVGNSCRRRSVLPSTAPPAHPQGLRSLFPFFWIVAALLKFSSSATTPLATSQEVKVTQQMAKAGRGDKHLKTGPERGYGAGADRGAGRTFPDPGLGLHAQVCSKLTWLVLGLCGGRDKRDAWLPGGHRTLAETRGSGRSSEANGPVVRGRCMTQCAVRQRHGLLRI